MSAEDHSTTGGLYRCPLCFKQYTIRSTYVRHSRQCLERTLSSPRQKSCRQCSSAKTRCDRKHPRCSRCVSRNVLCEYGINNLQEQKQEPSPTILTDDPLSRTTANTNYETATDTSIPVQWASDLRNSDYGTAIDGSLSVAQHLVEVPTVADAPDQQEEPTLDQQSSSLIANGLNIPASSNRGITEIRDRWFLPYLADSTPDRYSITKHALNFASRVLRTYPRMMARKEQLPPFIHQSQVLPGRTPPPIANCFSICRMWAGHAADGGGGDIIQVTIKQEMQKLFSEYQTYTVENLVGAIQALAIYSIILLFPEPQKPSSGIFDLKVLSSIQEICNFTADRAFILPAEKTHIRPLWEDWVVASCIRRTNVVLYIFEWIYSMLNDLPTFPCNDVCVMPAPSGKVLWSARTRKEWEETYDRWLGRWAGLDAPYRLARFSKVLPGPELDEPTEMWLEEADEFGLLYMALVNATTRGHNPDIK